MYVGYTVVPDIGDLRDWAVHGLTEGWASGWHPCRSAVVAWEGMGPAVENKFYYRCGDCYARAGLGPPAKHTG